MQKLKFLIVPLITFFAVFYIFTNEKVLVFQPKGIIAYKQLNLIILNLVLMLSIIVPTLVWLLFTIWKYQANHEHMQFDPEGTYSPFKQFMLWLMPSIIVAIMAIFTWQATHKLDPYRPIEPATDELTIQVVALNWKWLFIYPEQGIATLNFVQFPEKRPVRFELAADGSPMNSFWIPEMSGQIYCMTGMITRLHIMADCTGSYSGKAAEINGEGYAKMNFIAKSTTQAEFDSWVEKVRTSPLNLDAESYDQLLKPSIGDSQQFYSSVKKDLFHDIVMKVYRP